MHETQRIYIKARAAYSAVLKMRNEVMPSEEIAEAMNSAFKAMRIARAAQYAWANAILAN